MKKELTWATLDGRKIPLKDLETDHIRNIIGMLRRKGCMTMEDILNSLTMDDQMGAVFDLKKPSVTLEIMERELEKRKNGERRAIQEGSRNRSTGV